MLSLARRVVDFLVDAAAAIAAIALVAMMCVVVVDVIGRFFGSPLRGAQDIVKMSFVFVVFGGMAFCDRIGGHVAVDLFESRFPKRLNFWFTVFGALVGAVIFALIAWQVWEATKISILLNSATNILNLPRAPFQYCIVAFAVLTSVSMILRATLLRYEDTPHNTLEEEVL
jgi:TRAP-type C4-dicarboxylate transport system permease small subunit